jgi:hypothetical protein
MLVLILAAIAAAALVLSARGRGSDLPERVVIAATNRLPAYRRTWGQALAAELAVVQGRGQRWRFAAGVLRIALFPPAPRPTTARATAAMGIAATVVATVAAARLLPTLSVFVAALGLLTSGYATAVACRWPRSSTGRAQLAAGAMAITGVLAAVGAVIAVAATHPAATRDPTHVFSVVLAATLSGYLVAGLSATVTTRAERVTQWGGVVGAGAAVVASTIPLPTGAVVALIPPITVAATLATAVLVGVLTRSRAAGARAGLLAAVLMSPIQFAMTLIASQYVHPSALTNQYDIAAYARGGYPDAASYLLSDALGGSIVSLAVTLLAMYAVAAAVTAAAPRLRGG